MQSAVMACIHLAVAAAVRRDEAKRSDAEADWRTDALRTLRRTVLLYIAAYGTVWTVLWSTQFGRPFASYKFNARYEGVPGLFRKELRRWFVGCLIGCAYDVALRRAMALGKLAPLDSRGIGVPRALLLSLLASLFEDAHFYAVHRSLHNDWLYQNVHSVHHQSFNTNPFSGLSMHPVEQMGYFSALPLYVLAHAALGVRLHEFSYAVLKTALDIGPIFGHSGFGGLLGSAGFHYLHHTKRHWNFGASPIWDTLAGTRLRVSPYNSKWVGS